MPQRVTGEHVGGCIRDSFGQLHLGGLGLADLVRARGSAGTPAYVYALDAMEAGARELEAAFGSEPHLVAYAVKANSAGPVIRALASAGCGADVVSAGELDVALACGIAPRSIVFSGVAKLDEEIDRALSVGEDGIGAIQVESVEEIGRVAARAKALGRPGARIGVRVNPGLDKDALGTHDHIATGHDEAKFGVALVDLPAARDAIRREGALSWVGLTSHVGSQLTQVEPYADAARALFRLARELREGGVDTFRYVDCGGGFGIDYGQGCAVRPADFVRAALAVRREVGLDDLHLYIEPGRSLVAPHGVLLAQTVQTKCSGDRRWLFVDAGMNDLVRPAMYGAHHRIVPLQLDPHATAGNVSWRVAGPVCESSDDFGLHPLPANAPSAVALLDAGAYGYTMASRYNARALPAELFLRGGSVVHTRERAPRSEWVNDRVMNA